MRLDSKSGVRGLFLRADTRQPIRFVRWYDTETHEYEAFRCDPAIAKARGIPLRSLLYRGRARLEFQSAKPLDAKPTGRIAPSTPLAEIAPDVLRGRVAKPIIWLPGFTPPECQEPLCHRPAEWSVGVEQLVEPERGTDGKLWERAVMVDVSVWCSWHFKPPRQISQRGVEVELENIQARPQ